MPPSWLAFFERPFPSANMTLVRGERPVLIDTGYGSDFAKTERLLHAAGCGPERLSLIVNTHYHSDHVGGNHALQRRYAIPIAAHRWEADLINSRDREACAAAWLDQPVEPYHIERRLSDGDEIDAGGVVLRVLHTSGHTLGHISLYAPEDRALITGDALHRDDVGWLNLFREGAGALQRALESLDRLATLPVRSAYSGHGPAIDAPAVAIDAARRRYEGWLAHPEKLGWHACKRIFAYALMIHDGLPEERVGVYLLGCPWFQDFSRHIFALDPAEFVPLLIAEMIRSGAAGWRGGRLTSLAVHARTEPGWPRGPTLPRDWPPLDDAGAGTQGLLDREV